MTTPSQAQLATLLGSRLCHDLISPIGAIQNGLELIELSGGVQADSAEMSLIKDSCHNATTRIKFFRVAFGHSQEGQVVARSEMQSVLKELANGGRVKTEWQAPQDLSRTDIQIAFLAQMCCEASLPQGGTITINQDAAGWKITAQGPRLNTEHGLWDYMNGASEAPELKAKEVQFHMLRKLAEERGKKILATPFESSLTLMIA